MSEPKRINLIIDKPSDGDWGLFRELLKYYGGDERKGAKADLARDALRVLHADRIAKSTPRTL